MTRAWSFVVRRSSLVVLVGATCVVSGFSRTVRAQKVRERTADAILAAITSGSMSVQAIQLGTAEKRALAESLSGKALNSGYAPWKGMPGNVLLAFSTR